MIDKVIYAEKKRDFASGFDDFEELERRAGERSDAELRMPHEASRCRGLHCEATNRAPTRLKVRFEMWRECPAPACPVKPWVEWLGRWGCSIAILSLLLGAPGALLSASPQGGNPTNLSARELVQDVTRKEESARKNPQNYYKFVQEEKTPDGTKTSVRIETPDGEVGEVVDVDGKPPSKQVCRKDSDSLKKLSMDSKLQQRQAQEQKDQSDRIDNLMAAVPDAFIFTYQGKPQRGKWIVIKFRPNPVFQPQSREASLLKGMRGTLWVDPASHRLVKIDGTLIQDVSFGWGFLASLHRGGHFSMQQSIVPGGSWKQTYLQVDLDGSKLVFGQLHVHFKDVSQSFVRLTDPGTLAGAVNLLQHSPIACNENKDTGATAQAEIR